VRRPPHVSQGDPGVGVVAPVTRTMQSCMQSGSCRKAGHGGWNRNVLIASMSWWLEQKCSDSFNVMVVMEQKRSDSFNVYLHAVFVLCVTPRPCQ